ncbi:MAG: hypothetical protein AAGF76_10285 [Pseudomonadota bacterium]
MGQRNGAHRLRVDPTPDRMGVAADLAVEPPFFMEDNGAGLTGQTETRLRPIDGVFEGVRIDNGVLRRVEAERIEMLAAPGGAADRLGLLEGGHQIL